MSFKVVYFFYKRKVSMYVHDKIEDFFNFEVHLELKLVKILLPNLLKVAGQFFKKS